MSLATLASVVTAVADADVAQEAARAAAGAGAVPEDDLRPVFNCLHVRVEVPRDSEYVPSLLERLALAPGLTCSPWRQSMHRYYATTTGAPVHTATIHDVDVDAIKVTHASVSLLAPGSPAGAAGQGLGSRRRAAGPEHPLAGRLSTPSLSLRDRVVRLLWQSSAGPRAVTVTGRQARTVPQRDLPSRVDEVLVTTLVQTCVFSTTGQGPDDLAWHIEVGLQWPAATTTRVTQALKQGDDPLYTVMLTATNVGRAVRTRGCHYVTLDLLLKVAEVLDVPLLQQEGAGQQALCAAYVPVEVPVDEGMHLSPQSHALAALEALEGLEA